MTSRSNVLKTTILFAAAMTMGIVTAEAGSSADTVAPPPTLHQPDFPKPITGHTGSGDAQKGKSYPEGGGGGVTVPCFWDGDHCGNPEQPD